MPDLSNSASEDNDQVQQRTQAALKNQTGGADNRLTTIVDEARKAGIIRLNSAQVDLARSFANLREYANKNPAVQGADQTAKDDIADRVERFIDQQSGHLQESEARASKILDRLASAANDLAERQRGDLRRTPAAERPELEQHHDAQRNALADFAQAVGNELRDARRRDSDALRSERANVGAALSEGPVNLINAALINVDQQAEREQARARDQTTLSKHPDMNALIHAVVSKSAEINGALNAQDAERWRAQLGAVAKDLNDDAISRIKLAAESREKKDFAVSAIKGQLFEEIMTSPQEVAKLLAEAQKVLAERGIAAQAKFIPGDRIRDESGYRKLSDGLIAYEDEQSRLVVLKVLEAKAGQEFADKLVSQLDKETKAGQREIRNYARDTVRDELSGGKLNPADAQKQQAELESWLRAQHEAGQSRRSIERLTTDEKNTARIYIDGQRRELAFQRQPVVDTVTPNDVAVIQPLKADATEAERKERAIKERDATFRESRKIEYVTARQIDDAARRAAEFRDQERQRQRNSR